MRVGQLFVQRNTVAQTFNPGESLLLLDWNARRSRVLSLTLMEWPEIRQRRRAARLDAIRSAMAAVGAPAAATAMLLSLSSLDAPWPLHEPYGLPIKRIPDVIANTVRMIVEDLRRQVVAASLPPPKQPEKARRRKDY